jgi:hypothetical protein
MVKTLLAIIIALLGVIAYQAYELSLPPIVVTEANEYYLED